MTTILVVDGKADFREFVKRLLAGAAEVVGEAADGEEAVCLAARLAPEVVLLDLDVPGVDAVLAARRIKARRPSTKVILLMANDEEAYLAFTGKTGADVLLSKKDIRTQLLARIRAVTRQGGWDGRERRHREPGGSWRGRDRRRKPCELHEASS
jgi:DNA-binding NarL/FixJ family response regulator